MAELFPAGDRDEFNELISGARAEFEGLITYNHRDGYYGISLKDDLARLRQAFSGYVKELFRHEPGVEVRDEEYELIAYLMNRTDIGACPELHVGDMVGSTSAIVAFMKDFEHDGPIEAELFSEEDSLVGTFHSIAIVPVPELGAISDAGIDVDTRSYEPVLVIIDPAVEDSSGEKHALHATLAFVPFLDRNVSFIRRMQQERGL